MNDWVNNSGNNSLKALAAVYKTDVCVVDFASPTDTVTVVLQ